MDELIKTFLGEAAKANNWEGHLDLQWALSAAEMKQTSESTMIDMLMSQKYKS